MTSTDDRRDPERRLPADILALADWREGEAASLGFACSGGQVQVRLPEATAELYWQDFDPAEQRSSEDWPAFVARSWKEALFLAQGLPSDEILVEQASRISGLEHVPHAELKACLWFATYLQAPRS